ncbi:MAG: hypothetical protein FJ279_36155, partial [Planctomycetes bacterium]|nr:hypothetical protein [Planctomycetota bacterium]
RFLTQVARARSEVEAGLRLSDADVKAQAQGLVELPELRRQCFAELEKMLALKRRLDARPELRRFYLWAQLAALRPKSLAARHAGANPIPTPEFLAAAQQPPKSAGLVDVLVRPRLDLANDTGFVTIEASTSGRQRAQAGLFDASGALVAFAAQSAQAGVEDAPWRAAMLRVPSPRYWFPDCPYLYTVRIGIFQPDGKALDWREQPVAFRDIRIVESDVTAAMRHAWAWPVTDYTFVINGQPFFPLGTVCSPLPEQFGEQAADLFDELWLNFQRTYGRFATRLEGSLGRLFAERGLTFLAALGPNYKDIQHYASAASGLEEYRELARECKAVAGHPAVLTFEVGNEAELDIWGADLGRSYKNDLWQCFNEVTKVLREELAPSVPVSYTRAWGYKTVLPLPREDYSGVNQYTGRYSGRMSTMTAALGSLARATAYENKPFGVTEWNGPKYSWATNGVSGLEEEGSARYVHQYFENLMRTPMTVLSTEFVLNWVVTPTEDLTTLPLAEGMKRRDQWKWNLSLGTPWHPSIWPDLCLDLPARRAMRGFQSPLHPISTTPGALVIAASAAHKPAGERLRAALAALG